MIRFSKKVEYALLALLDLGERESLEVVTTKELAQHYNIPYDILGKVLQLLSKKDFIRSVQGVNGGYMMKRTMSNINLQEVIEAIDGPLKLTSCFTDSVIDCRQHPFCSIRTPITMIQQDLNEYFRGISLESLANRYHTKKVNKQVVAK